MNATLKRLQMELDRSSSKASAKTWKAEEAFWKAIPVGALLRPGAVDWIAHGLSVALATYSRDPAQGDVPLKPMGPLPSRVPAAILGFALGAAASGLAFLIVH